MKNEKLKISYYSVMFCVMFSFTLCGCISVPNSPEPRFYTLQLLDENQSGKKFDIALGLIVGVGPVKIPEYLNRPQIATQDKNKMLKFA